MAGLRGAVVFVLVLATVLALGAGGATANSTSPTTVLVEVIGGGKLVSDNQNGISCGEGALECYATFSESNGTLVLKATPDKGWNLESSPWVGSCTPESSTNKCDVNIDGNAHRVAVHFSNPNSTPLRTLSVAVPLTNTGTTASPTYYGGQVTDSAPPPNSTTPAPPGPVVNCGSDFADPTMQEADCTWDVLDQSTLTLVETPDSGFYFSGWGGDCAPAGSGKSCSVHMTGDAAAVANFANTIQTQTLTVHVVGNGKVTGGGISCGSGSTCDRDETQDAPVTLQAKADKGYLFTGWSGACTGTGTTCTVDMSTARDVTATFAQVFTLSVTVNGNGTVNGGTGFGVINCGVAGTGTCSAPEPANGTVTLTEVPAPGATFSGWSGACSSLSTVCTVSLNTDRSVTANFTGGTGGATFPLTISVSGSGSVTGPGVSCSSTCTSNVNANTSETLTATPASGATFNGWGGACAAFSTSSTCTITVSAAQTASASFTTAAPTSFPLSVTVSGNGTVTGGGINCGKTATACSQSFAPGTSVTLHATPSKGAKFVRWTGDCVGTTTSCVLVVGQSRSVTATFSGGSSGGGGGSAGTLKSLGAPTVAKTAHGYRVTLRFSTTAAGTITVQGLRAGRLITSFTFQSPIGSRTVGPFPVTLPGYYAFKVSLGAHVLTWHACLGTCGANAPASAGKFTVTKHAPGLKRAGAGWLVTLRFFESKPSGAQVRVTRPNGALLGVYSFTPGTGNVSLPRLVLTPGTYTLRVTATDAYGRVHVLVFSIELHS